MSITDELLAPSGPILKFPDVGDIHKIKVETISKAAVTDFATGEPQTWPNGDPKYQYVITGPSETYSEEPGATARLFLKSYAIDALRDALREAGVKGDADIINGTLTIKRLEDDAPKRAGHSGAHRFKARFEKGIAPTVVDDLI